MSDPGPHRPTSHRAPVAASTAARRLLGPLVAVAVVVAVIVVLILINGHHSGGSHDASPAITTGSPTPSGTSRSSSAAPSPDPTTSFTSSVTLTPSSSPTSRVKPQKTSKPARPHPTHRARPTATAVNAMAPVAVLNNSRRTGLARYVAAEVRSRGWTVYYVGNLRGLVAAPTAFFAPGDQAAAEHLAREFGSIRRVLPNSEAGLHTRGVTLVLTASWMG